jgi:type VI secretion system protein ImpA
MASPAVLDFDTLLAPIPGDSPTGTDLRTDRSPTSPYYTIKTARREARSQEERVASPDEESGRGEAPADWGPVRKIGIEALSEQTKDLEIAAYLIEALLRTDGFAGLRDGFRLARGLVDQFWDGLYPLPDEDGLATRVFSLAGLNGDADREGSLIAPISRVPLANSRTFGTFLFADYQHAVGLLTAKSEDPNAKARKTEQGNALLEKINQAVAETPVTFYQTLVGDLQECLAEFRGLSDSLDQRCGHDSPPTSAIRQAVEGCLEIVQRVAGARLKAAEEGAAAEEQAPGGDGEHAPAGGVAVGGGVIRSREDAFRNLLQVAEFFRRTEPHTVVSYALEQVVRWGRMPLPELLSELIPDEMIRLALFKQVGIRPPGTPENP